MRRDWFVQGGYLRRMQRLWPCAILITTLLLASCGDSAVGAAPGSFSRAKVEAAVAQFLPVAKRMLAKSGVPGVGISIVHGDDVVHAGGLGVRAVETGDAVDGRTVFQIASMSKPIASTVVASLVGQGVVAWDDPIVKYAPDFALSDPTVTARVTFADLFAHRSGLPDHAGDLLEDFGFTREEVIERLRYVPLRSYKESYGYTNFGLTEAAVVAAAAAGKTWEDASEEILYEPLGMGSTSSTFADFMARDNRGIPHVPDEAGEWVARFQRNPDAQSPAGGVSSSAEDLAKWMLLQIHDGRFRGEEVVSASALAETHRRQVVSKPAQEEGAEPSYYGLGWNVGTTPSGGRVLSHSGAFGLGAGTAVTILADDQVGISAITNGQPAGLAEALNRSFLDILTLGEVQHDYLAIFGPIFEEILHPPSKVEWANPPANPTSAAALSQMVGTYGNDFFGDVVVGETDGKLQFTIGPNRLTYALTHYDGNSFSFETSEESAVGASGAAFAVEGSNAATSVTIEWLDGYGMGTLLRR